MREHKNAQFHKTSKDIEGNSTSLDTSAPMSYLEVLCELQEAHQMQDSKAALAKIRALRARQKPSLNAGFEYCDE